MGLVLDFCQHFTATQCPNRKKSCLIATEDSIQARGLRVSNSFGCHPLTIPVEVAFGTMSFPFSADSPTLGVLPVWFVALWANFGCVVPWRESSRLSC